MTQLPSDDGGDGQLTDSARRDPSVSRRGVLEAAGAGLAGVGLASVAGTASAAGVTIAPLTRDGNRIVDPQGEPVTLRGVNVVDPARANRSWRGMDAEAVFEMATAHPDWSNSIVRVPIRPEFVATGRAAASGPSPADLPHGDDWGPAMPGTFDEATLRDYLDGVVDPLVQTAEDVGAYLMLDYHRHYPVFHHHEHEEYVNEADRQPIDDACYDDVGDVWDCDGDVDVDHTVLEGATEEFPVRSDLGRVPNVCGERGILWHGEDQIDVVRELAVEQDVVRYFFGVESEDDIYTEPPALCNALDREVRLFWEVVADEYGDSDAVLFDVYDEPTGPYAGDWGGPERVSSGFQYLSEPEDAYEYELWGEHAKPYYDLWVARSQPWMDVAENYGAGNVQTIGNPRWSQYVYWAPYNEYDNENVCYSAHVQTQHNCRPLQCTVGPAAEHVPVFFSDFGWMNFDRVVPTPWMDGGVEFATGEYDPYHEAPEGSGPTVEVENSWSFGRFLDEFPVHPICSAFDLARRPNFFESGCPDGGEFRGTTGARGEEHWYDEGHLIEADTPGGWWQEYVNDRETTVNEGSGYYPPVDAGPNDLHGAENGGYAFPTSERPGDCDASSPPACPDAEGDGVTVDGRDVCDVDGDGLHRDLTGDGFVGQTDVVEFFRVQHHDAWKRPELFDFSGDGSVGHGDVVQLFEDVATQP